MNKTLTEYFLLFCFFINFNANAQLITIAADPWCPYSCKSEDNKEGFLIDLFKEIFESKGYKVKYEIISWSRAINEVRSGNINAIAGAFKTDAPDFIFPTIPQVINENCFFTLTESQWTFKNINDLKSQKIGIIQDYSYDTEIDKIISDSSKHPEIEFDSVSGASSLDLNIKKLQNKRITAFIEEKSVLKYKMSKENLKLKQSGCLKKYDSFIAFSPNEKIKNDSLKYSKIISEELKLMQKNGKLKKLKEKYNL